MLTLVGLGLGGPESLTQAGIAAIREATAVFAEGYTSPLLPETLVWVEQKAGRVRLLSRAEVEQPETLLAAARDGDAVLLVSGDPLSATTHVSLRIQCRETGIECCVVHNASVLTAVAGELGLQHYRFGPVATLVSPKGDYHPLSPVKRVLQNIEAGFHSLVLLDIRADDPAAEPRLMTAIEGAALLLEGGVPAGVRACAAARVGRSDQRLWCGALDELEQAGLGEPPHSIVIPGELHFIEEEALAALQE
ncbi:MAG: diphthine synthase [Marine Group III euryarchaeote CG-Bathy2]|uniref:Diphthine synthase n=1 Tax=Marine Group III euryarchaeote CG-Bathy2 TaxID=1889002 RepID=A0A1J5SQL5_9ARCH|nr:MAG: diphthine synthase [Marine Group III euryarchaeote CG-Bathy2]